MSLRRTSRSRRARSGISMCLCPCGTSCPPAGLRKPALAACTISLMTTATTDAYAIPQELADLRDMIRQLAQEKIAPRAAEIDRTAEYPRDIRELLAEHDVLGLPFE